MRERRLEGLLRYLSRAVPSTKHFRSKLNGIRVLLISRSRRHRGGLAVSRGGGGPAVGHFLDLEDRVWLCLRTASNCALHCLSASSRKPKACMRAWKRSRDAGDLDAVDVITELSQSSLIGRKRGSGDCPRPKDSHPVPFPFAGMPAKHPITRSHSWVVYAEQVEETHMLTSSSSPMSQGKRASQSETKKHPPPRHNIAMLTPPSCRSECRVDARDPRPARTSPSGAQRPAAR